MSAFFSSLASKAQNAYEQSPISGQVSQLQSKLQQQHQSESPEQPSANHAAAQGGIGAKSQVLGNITHQFRNLQMQYANVPPTQRIITSQKGVCIDFDSVAKDSKSQSKELYMWGQTQDEDIKDVTDRLAYLNFVHGALSATLASELDASRSFFKKLRDAERALEPKRNARAGLETQIARLEHDQQKGSDKRLVDFKAQLSKAEAEDESAEKEIELLKRKAVAESERAKWAAIREYGEKLVLLAEASTSIVAALPSVPPSASQPYVGAQSTAATRASLQQALDNFKPGSISHSFQPSVADISRTDSRSFGVTHATELSGIASPSLSGSAHAESSAPQTNPFQPSGPVLSPPPVNPASLNNTPAPIPQKSSPSNSQASETTSIPSNVAPAPSVLSDTTSSPVQATTAPIHVPEPTIAETGVPVSAGAEGPGPAKGSLKDLKGATPPSATISGTIPAVGGISDKATTRLDTSGEEKARLQREEQERLSHTSAAAPQQKFESAEEEKKRLEKEERERLVKEAESQKGPSGNKDAGGDGATPPPYQDYSF